MPATDRMIEDRPARSRWPKWLDYPAALLLTFISTAVLRFIEPYLPLGRYPVIYVLVTMAAAYLFGLGPALVTFIASFIIFNYYFVPPEMSVWPIAVDPMGWAALVVLILGACIGCSAVMLLRRHQQRITELAEQLRKNEYKYHMLFESMTEMVAVERLVYDESGKPVSWLYEDVNPAYMEVARFTREEAQGRLVDEIYPARPVTGEQLEMYARVVATGQPERLEIHFQPLDKYLIVSAFPLGGDRLATVSTDITEIRKAEEALQRYQLLSKNARDIILFMNTDGRIIEANDAAVEAYCYSHEELLNLNMKDLRAPDTASETAEKIADAADGGILFETLHRRRDGSLFPVEVGSQGAVLGGERVLLSIIRDISERRRVEQQLDEERRRLQAVLDALPVGMFIADAAGKVVQANEAAIRIWGGRVPLVGSIDEYEAYKGWWTDTGEPIRPDEWAMARALDKGETSTGEIINIERVDGTQGTIIHNAAPIFDPKGNIVGGVAASEDITELVRLRQELERSLEEEKEESHRVSALESVAEAGITTLELQDLLNTLAQRMRTALGTHSCTVLVLDEDSGEFIVGGVCEEPLEPGSRFKATEGFIGKIYTDRRTTYVADAQTDPLVLSNHLKRTNARSLLGTPLMVRRRVVGVAYVDMTQVHHFTDDDIRLFEAMASRAASAIENAMLHEQLMRSREELEHNLSQLQKALVPTIPSIEGNYEVATVYVPALAAGQEIGGDFYDVFKTRDGRYAILIGDVSGKGIPAASMAASTRSTIHALAYESSCASDSLTRANAVLCSQYRDFGPFVTVFLAVLDLDTGEFCYSSAGHPPAVLCCEDGGIEFMKSGQPPVGLICDQEYEEHACRLEPGDKVIAYTDGITEARHGVELLELEGVARTIKEHWDLPANEMAQHILRAAIDWTNGHLTDDAAIVVVERCKGQTGPDSAGITTE